MTRLVELLDPARVLHLPTVWDGISARAAAEAGWDAVMTSGLGIAATMGLPDMDLFTADDSLRAVRIVSAAGDLAVLADLDNGYGGPVNVARVVREFEAAGASAMLLEDQASPKRCPFYPGEPPVLASVAASANKIRAAVEARADRSTLVIARTDAGTPDEIFRRCAAYVAAGADLVMPNAPDEDFTPAHWGKLSTELGVPIVASALPGSRLERELTDDVCVDAGIRIRIDALHALYASTAVLTRILGAMREHGIEAAGEFEMLSHHEFGVLMREDRYRAVQQRYDED